MAKNREKSHKSSTAKSLSSQLNNLLNTLLETPKEEESADVRKKPKRTPKKCGVDAGNSVSRETPPFECEECFKDYKYLSGLQRHKCPELPILPSTKMQCQETTTGLIDSSKKTASRRNTRNKRKTDDTLGISGAKEADTKETSVVEDIDRHTTKDSYETSVIFRNPHKKTIRFAEEVLNQSFKCCNCAQQFNHRRGYLHHMKTCITSDNEETSLSSLINDVYDYVMNR